MQDIASDSLEAIAIVGSSCRLPGGSHSPSKLWDLLKFPIDLAAEIQNNRFNAAGFYHPKAEHAGTSNVTKAYLLEDDPWTFDNDFFKISAREAESMDPQQRITLEIVYEAIECAGYSLSQLKGSSTGVFVGQMSDDYRDIILRDLDCHPQYTGTGIARSILANRVSYVFDWKGPSISIDTACSSSLVALHLAVQSLRSGECNMAVVIGVNSILSPEVFSFLSSLRMISPNGRSRMWDIHADGYARGEGYAAVVIKTLERAIDDYDDVESIIRNTGVNQDGRSTGLTVPNAASQAELIKSTYEKCGLNCKIEEDRCQYFEAHGTGTPAGDPKEAEAIDATFFRTLHQEALNSLLRTERLKNEKILVGSIKTVIGHLEGAAGLASVLKVSLAIQNGMIPPNLHFNQLNPAIEPYYGGLEVPRSLQQWPKLPTGVPRRASVNSFGFGGTNAHAIVESWDNESSSTKASSKSFCWGPFVVSANSHTALEATIVSLCEALKSKNDIELHRLAWTLQLRRSHLTYRASFAAVDKEELVTSLESAIKEKKQYPIGTKVVKASEAHILGVFTGQGAQWVSMGTELFLHSASFRRTIESLELALEEIANGPTWSLTKELMNQNNPERSLSAEISQPLCTAIQIALVDLLKASGITFSAVIGHSSGEIAAAYSADVLTATDAIVIAYYRGYHTHQSKVSGSNSGKMMAVGMAPEDAADFCLRKYFLGRINVAAINSPSSVTLAGDSNAIDEAKEILDEKAIFARILKVDTAYHSHHMECVREPYIESLQKANILPKRNTFKGSCNWYSSVYKRSDHRSMSSTVSFEHTYWADNMTKPVLFSSAIISAISKEHFNLVLEIGPHPALKGPTTECIKVASDNELPYYGVLEREKNSVKTFSNALGFVWRNIDSSTLSVDFKAFQKSCNGPNWKIPRVHKGFSPYPWDHDKPMLKESKKSKAWRTRSTPFHELLGYPSSNGDTREVRWRNILKLADVEWLQGHQFQDQVLFPAAAYLIMAVKAALHLFGHGKQPFQLVELQDFVIHNAITLEGGSSGTETNLVIKVVEESPTGGLAEFYCRSNNADTGLPDFDKEIFTGRVFVKFGAPTEDALPRRLIPSLPMTDVDTDRFYSWMSKIGLQYTNPFLLNSIKRRHNLATVTTVGNFDCGYPIHSATFDSVLQGLFAAFSYPGDGRLWTTYLPKSFRRVRFDICKCQETNYAENLRLVADCFVTRSSARNICGDVDVFRQYDDQAIIQVQGVVFDSLDIPSPANDQCMYWKTVWKREAFSQVESTKQDSTQTEIMDDYNLNEICERTSYFYLNQLYKEIGQEQVALLEGHLKEFMEFILKQVRPEKRSAPNSCWNTQWEFDTLESVKKLGEQDFASQPDLKLIHRVGSRLPSILRQSESISQVLKEDSMLETLYSQGLGVAETDHHLGALLDHLVHQFPCMRILEVGAGTGSSTSVALRHLKSGPEEYTFTNLSPSYFQAAQARFPEHKQFMRFKTLDIDQSPVEQGFQANSYDVIIAAHVLQATKSVSESLKHCRQLLRPGGYLILLEPVNQTRLRIPFLLSTSSLRWLNCEDSQSKGPPITEAQWNLLLLDNNFSGVDHALRDFEADSMHTCSVMISQAVDDQIKVLRDPLNRAGGVILMKKLLVIGGHSLAVSKVRANIKYLLGPFVEHIEMLDNLEDVQGNGENLGSAVVCLSGLEEATFATMNQQGVSAMQSLFREAKYIIWATRGCRADDPYANIAVGICRSVLREMPHLRLKLVDIDKIHLQKNRQDAIMLSEMLLQMIYLDMPSYNNILWGNETEVAVENGAVLIPRVVRDDISNDRFNALRRNITRITSHLANPLEISIGEEGVTIKEIESNLEDPQLITSSIQVMSSSLFSIFCSDDEQPFYLSMGTSANMEEMVVAISDKNISKIKNPEYTFSCKGSSNPDEMLLAILTVIVYESLFSSTNGTIWFHNVDDRTAEIIATIAGGKEASVFLTTSNSASKLVSAGKATYIHPRVTERELILLIPCNLKRFVDMGSCSDELVELIGYTSGGELDFHRNFRQLRLDQHISLLFSKSSLVKLLADYCSQPELLCDVGLLAENNSIKVGLLHEQKGAASATSIISWTGVDSVHVQVAPAAHSCLFTDQKTYFLIGLAGEVGLSLCEWMINCGAKYLAIASRNPKVPPEVRRVFEKQGVVVRIFSMDVADMESLKKVYHEIVSSMPPIAGVANGALVVRDHPFDAMSFEDLETVFKPKVVGTQNLDKLFFSTPLDFFILFSSIATVVGKPGQSSYVAANLFMSALAGQRRKRGLAASVMHFGMLLGFGFIHGQTGSLLEARFRQEDCWAIPEPDFHAIFAQAIVSGRPENNLDPDIIAGLGTEIDTPWRAISRFSHCRVIGDTSIANRYHDNGQPTQSIQDRLKRSHNGKEAYVVLRAAIASRVSLALSCPIESVGEHVGLISLGIDSLLAVEIRSWIFKILEVDLPVLKLLGGSSVSDICHSVLEKLPASLKAWVEDNKPPRDEPSHGITDDSTGSSQDSQLELTRSVRDSFGEPNQEGLLGNISTEELELPSHTFLGNTQADKERHQLSQAGYERMGDMSESQAQLYFLHEYLQSNAYNVAYFGQFHGRLDVQKLSWALRLVSKRHEALRSAYFIDISTGRPVQAVLPEPNFTLIHEATHGDEQFQTEIERVKEMKFDIENGVVMKVTVVSHSSSLHSIIFNHHHIALDGFSWNIFIAELAQMYSAGPNSIPKSINVQQPIDMVKRQLSELSMNNEKHQVDVAFWRKTYRSMPPQLPLFPFAKVKSRPSIKEYDYRINSSDFKLSHEMTKLIEKVALKIGVTPFHFYFTSFATFLGRCLGVSDIAIGVVNANRTDAEDMETIGHFLNMLPVYISLGASEKFEMIAKRSRDAVATVFSHPHTPNDTIDQQSLFQVVINYRKSSVSKTGFGNDGEIEWKGGVPAGNPYDLLLNVAAMPDWTYISLITQQSLYTAADGALLLKWYTRALEAVARDPSVEISKCPISNEADTAEAIELGRGSKMEGLWQGTLLDRIDKIAVKFSSDLAIIDEQAQNLTYAQTSARSIQIMRRLQAITPSLKFGSRVAMLLDPVADAVCCILAIMRLGYVWIPLDTRNHYQRLHAVVDESRPQVLVCHDGTKELAHQISTDLEFLTLISIDDTDDVHNPNENNTSVLEDIANDKINHKDQAAMILYTSGSTGVPKGVVLTNGGLLNQINGTTSTLRLQREITLQQSPLGFDLMLDQIFLALCTGGTIVIVNKPSRGDPMQIADLIVRHGVTLTHFVPSEYMLLLNYGYHILKNADSWRYAMSGGEKLSPVLRRAFYKLNCSGLQLVNVYGPAEITLACARGIVPYCEFNGLQDSQDYLQPSPNYNIEITDTDMSVLPVGFPGEICISGQGVGLGYLERPEETSRKFTHKESILSQSSSPSKIRVYRSGDKGRILPDGTLEVFGRLDGDSQVKIHGFRVELDEIANSIIHTSNGTIVSAAVSWRQSSGILVAFVVFDISFDENKSEFIEWLQSCLPLPQVMKPTVMVPMKLIPITSNGKTDRAAVDKISVPDPSNLNMTKNPTRALNRWEHLIKQIWEEVLSSRTAHDFERTQLRIDHNSDFFQVGGSSILMIKLKYLLEMQLGVKISMPELFHTSSLRSMANLVTVAKAAVNETASPTIPTFLGPKNITQVINWDLEIATIVEKLPRPRDIPSLSIKSSLSGSEELVVVLTGATGFIGKHLLSCLVQSPKVGQVHCVAIRPDASGKPRHVAVNSDKIVEYTGDLTEFNLGLSAAQFTFLAEHSHIIIHNGADVSLLKTYQSLRRANVISTRTLCSMAILRRLPVHYVSTASVAKVIQQKPLLEVPASPADADLLNSVDGYAASKWASEALLAKVAVESGIPVYIHRLAHVMGGDASELDAVGMMTKYSFLLHALPRIKEEAIEGQWDFVVVDSVVDELVRSAMKSAIDCGYPSTPQSKREEKRPAVFINHCSDVTIPHCELKEYLETTFGEPLGLMELKEWLQLAREKGIHPLIHEFFLAFDEGRGKMTLPMMSKGS